MDEYGVIKKFIHVLTTVLICLGYSYFISSRIPKGLIRLISLFPIISLFTVLPLYLPPLIFAISITSAVIWQTSLRLILFSFGKGPISRSEKQSFYKFILYATIPIRNPSSKLPNPTRKPPNFGLEVLVLAIDIAFIAKYKQEMHSRLLLICYGTFIFLGVDCTYTCSKFVFQALLGLELEPIFDTPYLSTSLQDFWGKRWNLIVTNLLGQGVYKPVRFVSGSVPAIFATFLVSGLWHELLYYCVTRRNPSWEMTAYFFLHGVCVILELAVKKCCKGRLHLPPFVSVPITLGFWMFTGVWLIMPPLVRDGVDAMVVQQLLSVMDFFLNGVALFIYYLGG